MDNQQVDNNNGEVVDEFSRAQEILAKLKQKQLEDCRRDVQAVLEKYNCMIDVEVALRENAVIPRLNIVHRPQQ